jgi:hypothetical protein
MEEGYVTETLHQQNEGDERRRWFKLTKSGARAAAEELFMYGQVLKRAPALKELLSNA